MNKPSIQIISSKKLVGIKTLISLSKFNPTSVWQEFMPRVKEIRNKTGDEKYSIQIYNKAFSYSKFNPKERFDYWAATEVLNFESIPSQMDTLEIPEGKYAVFLHKGDMSAFQNTLSFIYNEWLPVSKFKIDKRPHYEKLDHRYLGKDNLDSEEEVWVPIK